MTWRAAGGFMRWRMFWRDRERCVVVIVFVVVEKTDTRISRVNRRPFAISVCYCPDATHERGEFGRREKRARATVEIDRRGFPPRAFHSSPFCPGHDLANRHIVIHVLLRRDFQGRRGDKRGASRIVAQFLLLFPPHLFSRRLIFRSVVDNRFVIL